jgi:hypothetical protein
LSLHRIKFGPLPRFAGLAALLFNNPLGIAQDAAAAAGAMPPTASAIRAIPLDRAPLLFVDDAGVATKRGVVRTFHPARTRTAPVIEADRPWEYLRVYMWGTVHFEPTTGKFSLWYMGRLPPPGRDTVSLFATSDDGLHWTKPELGLHPFDGSTANNIIDPYGSAVLVDALERDPAKRFKGMGYHHDGYHALYSADGIHWIESARNPVLDGGDTVTLAQNPMTGEYLAFYKRPLNVRGLPRRVVWLSRSRDFETWSAPELVLVPDEADDEWTTSAEERTEIYDMAVYPHAAGFIGLPAMFRHCPQALQPADEAAGAVSADGPIDIQIVSSADGRTWRRSWPRIAVIPRGAPGTFDCGAILGVACAPVDTARETWVYYTAINSTHGAPVPPKRISIGRAEWRLHGFASLDAYVPTGRIETIALQITGPALVVNADASRGWLRVALLEADGRAVPGYGLGDCEPLTADATGWIARWRDKDGIPVDRPVRVVVEMSNAQLFSIASGSMTDR